MKAELSIKTLFRTPVKTILTFLLLAAISGAFFFGVSEYVATTREMNAAIGYYKGVGAISGETPQQKDDEFWARTYSSGSAQAPATGEFGAYALDTYLYADPRVENNPYKHDLGQFVYDGLSPGDINAITNLPYVTRTSERYMGAGVSENLVRADYRGHYFNFTDRFVIEATLSEVIMMFEYHPTDGGRSNRQYLSEGGDWEAPAAGGWNSLMIYFDLNDAEVLAGDSSWFFDGRDSGDRLPENTMLVISSIEFSPDNEIGSIAPIWLDPVGTRVIGVHQYGEDVYDDVYNHDVIHGLSIGERYVVVGRYYTWEPRSDWGNMIYLGDPSTFGWTSQIFSIEGFPDNYLELDEFEALRQLVEITNADRHTFDVVYTDDMSSIMRFAEGNMQITDGRMLTDEDVANGNRVCVMNSVYMRKNNLNIGDVITLSLGDKLFGQNPVIGAVASVRERYADSFMEVDFEIVGAYRDVDTADQQTKTLLWTYSDSTIFVPLSCMPATVPESYAPKPAEFTFIIDDPRDVAAFLNDCKPIIENELGLTVLFSDLGWSVVEPQLRQASAAAMLRFLLFSLSMLIAIGLTVYLFIVRKRKDYAIMRALGTPVRRTNRSLYLPLGLLAAIGFTVGSILASILTGGTAETAASQLTEASVTVSQTAPAMIILVCIACELAALALITAFSLNITGRKPPLELLQTGAQK